MKIYLGLNYDLADRFYPWWMAKADKTDCNSIHNIYTKNLSIFESTINLLLNSYKTHMRSYKIGKSGSIYVEWIWRCVFTMGAATLKSLEISVKLVVYY